MGGDMATHNGPRREVSGGRGIGARAGALGMTAVLLFAGSAVVPPVVQAQEVPSGSAASHTSSLESAERLSTIVNPGDGRSFYERDPAVDLAAAQPGEVLRQREIALHIAGMATPVDVTQLQYRTTDTQGRPSFNVTSVLHPTVPADGRVVAYQSAYDSLNAEDGPSRALAGNFSLGGGIATVESAIMLPILQSGASVVMADTEGVDANFAAGPEYGMATLDSLRAARNAEVGGVRADSRIAMIGYSGGAIATNWASILMDTYAPELRPDVVGAAQGGLLVNPLNNLTYAIEGPLWSGVVMMAIIGLARAYEVDVDPYLTETGRYFADQMESASIVDGFGRGAGLAWEDIVKPEYPTPLDVPPIKEIVDKVNMGTAPVPDIPMLLVQGGGGYIELTPPGGENTGAGDGVMIAGDVRALAHRYCEAGTPIVYREYDIASHVMAGVPYALETVGWVNDRFAGVPAPSNCGTYPPGNDLTRGGHGGQFPVPLSQS